MSAFSRFFFTKKPFSWFASLNFIPCSVALFSLRLTGISNVLERYTSEKIIIVFIINFHPHDAVHEIMSEAKEKCANVTNISEGFDWSCCSEKHKKYARRTSLPERWRHLLELNVCFNSECAFVYCLYHIPTKSNDESNCISNWKRCRVIEKYRKAGVYLTMFCGDESFFRCTQCEQCFTIYIFIGFSAPTRSDQFDRIAFARAESHP